MHNQAPSSPLVPTNSSITSPNPPNVNADEATHTSSPKIKEQTSETIWKVSFIVVTAFFAALFKRILLYRSQDTVPLHGSFSHILTSLPLILLIYATRKWMEKYIAAKVETLLSHARYPLQEKRELRALLVTKWLYDIFYYSITTVAGVLVMKDHQSFPRISLEDGIQCRNVLTQTVPRDLQFEMEALYLLQMNHHLYALLSHLLSRNLYGKTKFFEYTLHHGLAVFLIFYSYMFNLWAVGLLVLIFHDVSDAFLIAGRTYLDMRFKRDAIMPFVALVVLAVWVCTRLILFPACCIWPIYSWAKSPELLFMGAMEVGLLMMHLFWTYHMVRIVRENKRKTDY